MVNIGAGAALYIGNNGSIPWNIPEDMDHFKELTTSKLNEQLYSIVIMGRKTWESIPEKNRPLNERFNIVLSNDMQYIARENAKYENIMINSKMGVYFTTWKNYFNNSNNSEYIKLENLLLSKIACVRNENSYKAFTYYIIGGEQIYNM